MGGSVFRWPTASFWRRRGDGGVRARVLGDEIGVGAKAVAGALYLDDDGMVKQSIEQRGGDDGIPEDLAPFGEATIGGEDHRGLFVRALTSWKKRLAPPGVIGR